MVTVTPFMGKLKVHIRQFYVNEKGEKKPGKNGKVLEHGEFEALAKLVPKVQDSIARYELKDTGMPLGKTHKSILLRETFFCTFEGGGGGGGGYTRKHFSSRNYWKNLVSKKEYYRQHSFEPNKSFELGQIWHRQLHSGLPICAIHMNYRPTSLGLGLTLQVIYINKRTH